MYGADEQTECVALFFFEGCPYLVGFTLLRYGDEWKVGDQSSVMANIGPLGAAQPMTKEEVTELTPD